MSDVAAPTASSPPAAGTTTTASKKSPKKAKVKPSHPPTSEMVCNAIKSLKERGGSSLQAIKKYVATNYKVDAEKVAPFIKKYLKTAVSSGVLVQTKGKGASGSFKLASAVSSTPSSGKTEAKTSVKKATGRPKAGKKVGGAGKVKKSSSEKKSAPAKVKKASSEKKTATKAKAAAVSATPKSPSKAKKTSKAGPTKKPKAPKPKKTKIAPKATPKKATPKKK